MLPAQEREGVGVPVWERACARTCVPNATPSLQLAEKDMHTEGSSHGKAERGENSGRTCPFLCRKWRRDTRHRQPWCPVSRQASRFLPPCKSSGYRNQASKKKATGSTVRYYDRVVETTRLNRARGRQSCNAALPSAPALLSQLASGPASV